MKKTMEQVRYAGTYIEFEFQVKQRRESSQKNQNSKKMKIVERKTWHVEINR